MRTTREAKLPSQRLGMFNYKPDRHYVLVQRVGPDWEFDTLSDLLNTYDPATGEKAYKIEADGAADGGAQYTGKANAILVSCSKVYHDAVMKKAVARSKQMKDADFSLGAFQGGTEWTPPAMPETPVQIGEAISAMTAIKARQSGESYEFGNPELDN